MTSATITRKMHTGEATDNVGHFGSKSQSADDTVLAPQDRQSAFIDASPANQEAAVMYFGGHPWANAEDFEDALFDTFDDEHEYYAAASDPEQGLSMVLDYINPVTMPSGAIAVFYKD